VNPISITNLTAAGENAWAKAFGGGVADLRPMPSDVIAKAPQRTVRRYRLDETPAQRTPVLFVPPLAAPVQCFDLHRGCTLAGFLIALGYPTYLVDYGWISFEDRDLGLEHWVEEVIPKAAETVLEDSGAERVALVGWSLGGIMALLTVADGRVPASSISMVGSPFDFGRVAMMAPVRRLADITGGRIVTSLYRALGGTPAPLVRVGFRMTSLQREVMKPYWIATHLDDREALAHTEAVDRLMANMIAYPGRTFGQLYHQFFRVNDLADGRMTMRDREIDLAAVKTPVLSVAGPADVLAPVSAVHAVGELLPNSANVRLELAPGGHLGILTGRSAERTTWRYLDEFLLESD
jgi:polyhydroxyalkanoate synthase